MQGRAIDADTALIATKEEPVDQTAPKSLKTIVENFGLAGRGTFISIYFTGEVVGDPGIEPGVRLREGVTVPCHTLRPVAHLPAALAADCG